MLCCVVVRALWATILRMTIIISVTSAFVLTSPLVTMMIPVVQVRARKGGEGGGDGMGGVRACLYLGTYVCACRGHCCWRGRSIMASRPLHFGA